MTARRWRPRVMEPRSENRGTAVCPCSPSSYPLSPKGFGLDRMANPPNPPLRAIRFGAVNSSVGKLFHFCYRNFVVNPFATTPRAPREGCVRTARQRTGAFTLIELLIVVSIISILASIAVPNFLEAQTRAKVARVKADMRSVATALEAYAVDNNKYPPRKPARTTAFRVIGDANTRAEDLARITTPIQYMTKVPIDIFENRLAPPNNLFDYWDSVILDGIAGDYTGTPPWCLVSIGPDGEMGMFAQWGNLPYQSANLAGYRSDYDPTNGTISDGNIYRGPSNETAVDIRF
ncbi:MAG: hypothetical protein PWP23_2559 [Candidatus Sumerlaeota bacterium]|nr:hypothetical protein [Candidatus Sumerlaeota bacterium]